MIFHFSGTLLRFVDFQREIPVAAPTVKDGLVGLVQQQPQLRPVLFDGEGNVRATHRLFLNGEQMPSGSLESPVAESDRIDILTAIAGG